MSRTQAVAIENNFIKGLVTETTALKFPPNACTETFDCVFDEIGKVSRRLGLDAEEGYTAVDSPIVEDEVFTEYLWNSVAGDGDRSFFVQQKGSTLYLFDVSLSSVVSANAPVGEIDLTPFLPEGSGFDPAVYQFQYSSGNGDLIAVSPVTDPIFVSYDVSAGTVSATAIDIQTRDFIGLDDGLDLTERVTSTVAQLKVSNPKHYYNLLNQGWHATDALEQWDTARTDMPSNADYIALYRGSETDAFDNTRVTAQSPGNRFATKGHFLLTPYTVDRDAAMIAEGFIDAEIDETISLIGQSVGVSSNRGLSSSVTNWYNGSITDASPSLGAFNRHSIYLIKDYRSSPKRLEKSIVYGDFNGNGFVYEFLGPIILEGIVINLYGSNSSADADPIDPPEDGVLLSSTSFINNAGVSSGVTLTSSDQDTFWNWMWIEILHTGPAVNNLMVVSEVEFYGFPAEATNVVTIKRPKTTAFFAGRSWYAGVDDLNLNNTIYYSQIITDRAQYGRCYQKNDPTAEDFFDLLPDDGGEIKIVDTASIVKLFAFQTSLIVISSNGVWLIAGGASGGFTANDYVVRKISSQGCKSPLSVVDANGKPVWWGDDGIFTVDYSAENDSFNVVSLTDQTIREFFLAIPTSNRAYVKGAFDPVAGLAYWMYNNDGDITAADYYKYTNVLVLNSASNAFYPWTINGNGPDVRGINFVRDASRNGTPAIKVTTTVPTSSTNEDMFFSSFDSSTYTDWAEVADDYSDPTMEESYSSYFITGYRIDGQGHKFFQSSWVLVYLEQETDSSCYLQGLWDFSNSSDSGKWSTSQQIYNSGIFNRAVNHRRLKVRGKGKALQLKFTSEEGKPFNIVGWVMPENSSGAA